MPIIKFKIRLDEKDYTQKPNLPNISLACDELKERICENSYNNLDDIICEVADNNVDKYTPDLVRNCSGVAFFPYINEAMQEFGKFTDIEKLYRTSQYCYYHSELYNNINTIIQNAIIEFLKNKEISIEATLDEAEDIKASMYDYIINYIDDFDCVNSSKNAIIENFINDVVEYAEEITETQKATIKMSEANDDDDYEANQVKALLIEVGKEPEVVYLSPNSSQRLPQLQALVGGLIQCVPLDSQTKTSVDLIVNDEGKLIGLEQNFLLREKHFDCSLSDRVCDVVCGNALIVGADEETGEFVSLPEEEIKRWSKEFSLSYTPFLGSTYMKNEHKSKVFDEPEKAKTTQKDFDFSEDFDER